MLPSTSEVGDLNMDLLGWFRNTSKTISSEPIVLNSFQYVRNKQLAQMDLLPFRTIEIKKESEYKVIINESPEFSLYVTFPPLFPHEKPQIRVSTPLVHLWIVDKIYVKKCPQIDDFGVHTDIGRVIKEIAEELGQAHTKTQSVNLPQSGGPRLIYAPSQLPHSVTLPQHLQLPNTTTTTTQPSFMRFSSVGPSNIGVATTFSQHPSTTSSTPATFPSSYSCYIPSLAQQPQQQPPQQPPPPSSSSSNFLMSSNSRSNNFYPHNNMPDVSSTILSPAENHRVEITSVQDLDKLSTEEILLTLKDQDTLENLVVNCHGDQIELYKSRRKDFAKQLEDLAYLNFELKKTVEEKKSQFAEKGKEWQLLKDKVQSSTQELNKKSKSVLDSEIMLDTLKVVAMEAEEKSDGIAASFIEGKTNVDEFLKAFEEQRKLFHIRTIKMDKFNDLLYYGVPF